MPGLTASLATMVSSLRYEALPAEVAATSKLGITDCTAAMLAGRDEPVSQLMADMVSPASQGEARVLFDRGFAKAPDAALVNGCASHCLEYDDPTLFHVSAVLVPAVLAEGEACESTGKEMIAAYAAGYEVWSELMSRDQDRHHDKGWHPTGVFGTLGAAAAAARIHSLDPERACAALAIAASMAAGLVPNFGTMTKPFHAGRAAQNGILAARLAKRGMTAAPDVLEHPRGFLHAISPGGRVRTDAVLAAGQDWHMLRQGLSIRRYPMCYATNRAIDATLGLLSRHRFAPEAVKDIEVTMGRAQYIPLRYQHPSTPLEAKFSMNFAVACAIVAGRVTLAELNAGFIARPVLQALFPKVRVVTIDGFDPDFPMSLLGPYDRVKVTLADGTLLDSEPLRFPKGHMRNPLSREELFSKFRACSANALSALACERLFERLQGLEEQPDIRALYESR
jgi:2-methylcitrate dehydratase PrpD